MDIIENNAKNNPASGAGGNNERYNLRGVSASKEDVHNAIKNTDKGLYPKAFCKIIPDYLGNDSEYCNIMHADGAGTKSALAIYRDWETIGRAQRLNSSHSGEARMPSSA